MNPGPKDVFTMVYPKYISIYALAKYKSNPVAARYALLNNFDTIQAELTTQVEQESAQRAAFTANPQLASCTALSNITLGLYGQLISVYAKSQELNALEGTTEAVHAENIDRQNSVMGACSNQGATPSAACIKLATQHEKLFPTLPIYTMANMSILDNGMTIQNAISVLLQAYSGMGCSMPQGSGSISIATVFSSEYLNSLETADTVSLTSTLQQLSPYYVSPTVIKYVAGEIMGVPDLNSELTTTVDYVADMKRATNNMISLNTMAGSGLAGGQFYNQATGSMGTCPPGYYCTDAATMPTLCPVGGYCPAGATKPVPCTNGQFSPEGATSASQCGPSAPAGYYLDSTNKAVKCPTGSYCLNGARIICPAGTYNMKQGMGAPTSCLPCPAGGYCDSPTKITPCNAGTFNPLTGKTAATACGACEAGTYCPAKGMATPIPCGPGTFSIGPTTSGSKTIGPTQCTPVAAGYYLPGKGNTSGPGMLCPPGAYCPGGSGTPLDCPIGSYCSSGGTGTSGITVPIPCPAGTYGSTVNLSTPACSGPCLAGYICPAGSTINAVTKCPAGYYCPTGSGAGIPCSAGGYCPIGVSTPVPCPANTYNPTSSTQNITLDTACLPCPIGRVCNDPRGTTTPGTCPKGYYCPYGSEQQQCYAGTYCPTEGLSAPIPCPAGTYCDKDGMITPTNCPTGTYSTTSGQTSSSVCLTCPPGSYCPANGSGSSTSTPAAAVLPCPPGTVCPGGATPAPQQCPIGQVCPVPGMNSGSPCPPGSICNTPGQVVPGAACPAGTYSLGGASGSGSCRPCPSGTYGLGGDTTAACSGQCPVGYHCPPNTTNPTANMCPAGFVCPAGSDLTDYYNFRSTFLTATATGIKYSYFAAGVNAGWSNSGSTWSKTITYPSKVLTNSNYTLSTTTSLTAYQAAWPTGWPVYSDASWRINGTTLSTCVESPIYTSKSCSVKAPDTAQKLSLVYISPGTTVTTQSAQFGAATTTISIDVIKDPRCPVGHFLRAPTDSQCTACPPGTFNNTIASTSCNYCPAGQYSPTSGSFACTTCSATDLATYTCPGVTPTTSIYNGGINLVKGLDGRYICPAGYYRLTGASACMICPGGYYCAAGLSYATMPLIKGTACSLTNTPPGSYCPAGTTPNAAGTGPNSIPCNLTNAPPGRYCIGGTSLAEVLETPTGPFYQAPQCPGGFTCAGGSAPPVKCSVGTASTALGQTVCTPCTAVAGRYCPEGATSLAGVPCPAGSYCTGGSAGSTPCTAPAGKYCPASSTTSDGIQCPAGSYCNGGAAAPIACTTGVYCPAGTTSSAGVVCPPGFRCTTSVATQCPAGSYCPTSITQMACTSTTTPRGTYCPAGSRVANTPCPIGYTCAGAAAPAVLCAAGTYCTGGAAPAIACSSTTTPPGSYCPAGGGNSRTPCPGGYTCAGGAAAPVICPAGTYCLTGSSTPTSCAGSSIAPAGTYCPAGSTAPMPCPGGSTCSGGTSTPVTCPAGTYCPAGSITSISCSALTGVYCLAGVASPWACVSAVTTFAGSGTAALTDGQGTLAAFNTPRGMVIDSTGNLYVTDYFGHTIRKITPSGVVSTLAGSSIGAFVDETGAAARFALPYGIAIDSAGTLYVADTGNHAIRKITSAGVVTTLAGSGTAGYVDGTGRGASFNMPIGVAVDSTGTVYVADRLNNRIRTITASGVVTTFAVTPLPSGINVDSAKNLYVTDSNSIRKITSQGVVSTFVGGVNGYTDGVGSDAKFNYPSFLTFDSLGNIYVSDSGNHRIRLVTPSGTVSTLAGSGMGGFVDGVGIAARFSGPYGIAITATGMIYVVDSNNNRIRAFSRVASCNNQTGL